MRVEPNWPGVYSLDLVGANLFIAQLDQPELRKFFQLPITHRDQIDIVSHPHPEIMLRSRALARQIIAKRLDINPVAVEIAYDAQGAPFLLRPKVRLHLSFTRRGPLWTLAIAEKRIGVDIETPSAGSTIPWNILRDEEKKWIEERQLEEQYIHFLRIWTLKEAFLKAIGSGLLRDPRHIILEFRDARRVAINDSERPTLKHPGEVVCGKIFGSHYILSAAIYETSH